MTLNKIVVSGASGLVGFHICRHLLERGHAVVALVRSSSRIDHLQQLQPAEKLQIKFSELTDRQSLREAMQSADVVIHCAGAVDPLGRKDAIMATNVEGTRNMLEAAIEASAKQFVHISSLSVITGQGDQYNVNEDAPLRYCGEPYADSKVSAEKVVSSRNYADKIHVTILRPGFIYGPLEKTWMPRLISSISSGKAMLIDGGKKATNVIYIGNLCLAVEASLMNHKSFGQVYNLTDGQNISKKDLFGAISEGLSLPAVKRTVPGPLAFAVCELVSGIAPFLQVETQRKLARFSRAAFRLAGVNQGFDISKAERDLGYTKRIPFALGMAETLKHFRGEAECCPHSAAPRRDLTEIKS